MENILKLIISIETPSTLRNEYNCNRFNPKNQSNFKILDYHFRLFLNFVIAVGY